MMVNFYRTKCKHCGADAAYKCPLRSDARKKPATNPLDDTNYCWECKQLVRWEDISSDEIEREYNLWKGEQGPMGMPGMPTRETP